MTTRNSSRFGCACFSWRAPGGRTVRPTTSWSDPAARASIRNCTCMSIQPSSSRRPCSSGTSSIVVRYGFNPTSQSSEHLVDGDPFLLAETGCANQREHLVRERRKRQRRAELAAELEPELLVLLLQRGVRERCLRHAALEDHRRAVLQHRRRDHALQHCV